MCVGVLLPLSHFCLCISVWECDCRVVIFYFRS
uniref:Uncharacterized protein n=1 Tax=Anguilla anguilla TaxID=7936 RepID=A0A0E9UF69_ANGAN